MIKFGIFMLLAWLVVYPHLGTGLSIIVLTVVGVFVIIYADDL